MAIQGISKDQQVDSKDSIRDVRTWQQKLSKYLKTLEGMVIYFIFVVLFLAVFNHIWEIWTFIGVTGAFWMMSQNVVLPFRMPKSSGLLDPNDPPAGSIKPGPSSGISYFGNEKETNEEIWFNNGDMRTHIILFGSTGAGKALRTNEKILTPSGWILNKDIKVGNKVCTPHGGVSEVVGVYPQGIMQLYKVNFKDDRSIEVTGDHLWEVHNKDWPEHKVLNTLSIMEKLERYKQVYTVPLCGVQHQNQEDIDLPVDPYILGVLLGDACLVNKNVRFSTEDTEIVERINSILTNNNSNTILNQSPFLKSFEYGFMYVQDCKEFGREPIGTYYKQDFLQGIQSLGLYGLKNDNKFVPEIYKNASIKQKLALIQGYLDINGDVDSNVGKIEFSTTSRKLCDDVREMLYSLGAVVKVSERKTRFADLSIKNKGKKFYRTYIKHSQPSQLVSLTRKKDVLKSYQHDESLKLQITSIEKLDKFEECQCIKIADPRGVFVTKDYIVTHNTEALVSLAFNALVHGSGFVYVDGKGDNSLWEKIFSLARVMGREDDLLVINYMTGSTDVFGPQKTKLSNTLNPFTTGSSGGLTELLVSLMDDAGGDNAMWKGRAISLISSIMLALVDLRDRKEILLDVDVIREYLILENISKLAKRRDLPSHVTQSIRSYLRSLPGYQENSNKQSETVMDQHGYLQMQFTKILGSLADSYGYIFRTNLGEVDFWDVVLNRRILVVLLPALEKSPEELANLGKIIVACLKQMMSAGLGAKLEGTRRDVIETKPTNAASPFMCILDEYGYYAVKGAAVMPAQARSLGFSMVFAGQDYPALEKASKEEAASTLGNCNIKIFMKLEDPEKTFDLALKSAGRITVVKSDGYERTPDMFGMGTYHKTNAGARFEEKDRISLIDLKNQREGEAHILFKGDLVRANMFYANPPKSSDLQLNHFLPVRPPEKEEIAKLDEGIKILKEKLLGEPFDPSEADFFEIKLAEKILKEKPIKNGDKKEVENSIATMFGYLLALGEAPAENFKENVRHLLEDDEDKEKINLFDDEIEEEMREYNKLIEDDEDEDEGASDFEEEMKRRKRRKAIEALDDDDEENEDEDLFLNEEETRDKFEEIEKMSGNEDNARNDADRTIEDIKAASEYPKRGAPDDQAIDDVLSIIKELTEDLKEDDK